MFRSAVNVAAPASSHAVRELRVGDQPRDVRYRRPRPSEAAEADPARARHQRPRVALGPRPHDDVVRVPPRRAVETHPAPSDPGTKWSAPYAPNAARRPGCVPFRLASATGPLEEGVGVEADDAPPRRDVQPQPRQDLHRDAGVQVAREPVGADVDLEVRPPRAGPGRPRTGRCGATAGRPGTGSSALKDRSPACFAHQSVPAIRHADTRALRWHGSQASTVRCDRDDEVRLRLRLAEHVGLEAQRVRL